MNFDHKKSYDQEIVRISPRNWLARSIFDMFSQIEIIIFNILN